MDSGLPSRDVCASKAGISEVAMEDDCSMPTGLLIYPRF